jgi:hypothetical protein
MQNSGGNCKVCRFWYHLKFSRENPKENKILQTFFELLEPDIENRSMELISTQAKFYYNNCILGMRDIPAYGEINIPDLSGQEILYHIKNCSNSLKNMRARIIDESMRMTLRYQKKIRELLENQDDDDDGDDDDDEKYSKIQTLQNLVLGEVNITTRTAKISLLMK